MGYLLALSFFFSSLVHAGGVTSGTTPERVFLRCQFAEGALELRTSFANGVIATLALHEGESQRFAFFKSAITKPVFKLELSDRVLVVEDVSPRSSRHEWGATVAFFVVNETSTPIQCLVRDL